MLGSSSLDFLMTILHSEEMRENDAYQIRKRHLALFMFERMQISEATQIDILLSDHDIAQGNAG
jgi:hypothetical protein